MNKKKIFTIFIIILILINLIYTPSFAVDEQNELSLYSETAVLIDTNTGKILYGKDETKKMYPASTTKILTAIIALENCKLDDTVTASRKAVMSIPAGYSNAAIQPNETLTVKQLLDVFLVHSANEAGYILAEHISGSIEEFAKLMNEKVTEIGCKGTNFTNPSGIHDVNHYSTALDMALIARYCMKNEDFRKIVSQSSCTVSSTDMYEERYFVNTNDMIRPSSKYYYENCIGIKTGYTSQAKNCLISSSIKDGVELICVVLGASVTENNSSARYVDTKAIFEYGFSNYSNKTILSKNDIIKELVIENGTKDTKNLELKASKDIEVLVSNEVNLETIKKQILLNEEILAPIAENSVLGTISYEIDGITYTADLLASHSVEKSNILLFIAIITTAFIILIILILFLLKLFGTKKKKYKKMKFRNSIY